MMAAMMLPGAVPAVVRRAHASGRVRAVPLFVGSYLAVWAVAGAAVYALFRPHGSLAAGAVVIAAGPTNSRHPSGASAGPAARRRLGTGVRGLLRRLEHRADAMLVALGVMSITWMAVIAVLATAQKLLPPRAALDVPLALAIVAFGVLIIVDPRRFPG